MVHKIYVCPYTDKIRRDWIILFCKSYNCTITDVSQPKHDTLENINTWALLHVSLNIWLQCCVRYQLWSILGVYYECHDVTIRNNDLYLAEVKSALSNFCPKTAMNSRMSARWGLTVSNS